MKRKRKLGIAAGLLTALGSSSAADAFFERAPITQISLFDEARYYPDRSHCRSYWGKGCTGVQSQYYRNHNYNHHRAP